MLLSCVLCYVLQFPYSARHGLEWWEIDPTWYLICILKFLGIVWDVQVSWSRRGCWLPATGC